MKRLITNLVAALVCTSCCAFLHSTGTATTLQDLINQACDPTSSQGLPPCEGELSLEELRSRLQYSVEMFQLKDELTKSVMASWNKNIGLLYITPTQKVWELNKNFALSFLTDTVLEQVSRTIDAQGALFLLGANGDPELALY